MNIRVAPFTVDSIHKSGAPMTRDTEEHIKKNNLPITLWGVYLDSKLVFLAPTKEAAEKMRSWLEKWLE